MSSLFSPLVIKGITLKNRIGISPMCEYSSVDGFANDWHLVHLGSRAVGGAGLVMQEATAVSPEGRISYGDMGIWKDDHIQMLSRIVAFIHAHGAVAGIQLAHAGRKASHDLPWNGEKQIMDGPNSWQTVAPSAIPFNNTEKIPTELDHKAVAGVVEDFKNAAIRAMKAGYRIIEIHAAHGYLINEFLSPLSNKRTDNYGGSFENRARFLLEIVEAIQSVWPSENPLFVRLSATDWTEGGWTIEDSVMLASILKEKGVDLVDASSGGVIGGVRIPLVPGYQVPLAEAIRKTGILTAAVGLITTPQQAESIIAEGKADLIFIARESLRDPYFPLRAAHELNADIEWPKQYTRAKLKPV